MFKTSKWYAFGLIGALLLGMIIVACVGPAPAPSAASNASAPVAQTTRNLRFVVVTHGQPSDPYWSVVQNGVAQAGKDIGVKVEYQAPTKFDMVAMAQLIDAAVASKPDGLVVSIPDAAALSKSIKAAVAAGIPVISIDSGSDVAAEMGVLNHVGQTEYEAGFGGGEQMAAAGAKNALCVNQEVGNAALNLRCKGFTDALAKTGGKVSVVPVQLADPTGTQQSIAAALSADPTIDSILTLGPTGAEPAMKALTDGGMLSKIKLATFDLSPEVLDALEKGDMLFAIDSQQYLQGYLPIVMLTLYKENLNTIANPIIMTDPGFVTKENAGRIKDLAKAGTR